MRAAGLNFDFLLRERNRMAKVTSVNISRKKGTVKQPVDHIRLVKGHGIEGDAHAGDWHRQISLLGEESIDKIRYKVPGIRPGVFAENIDTSGIILFELPVGTRLKIGTALCEVTQIGKECHQGCRIKEITGDCVMPREGIFVIVLQDGEVRAGDEIVIAD
jgi:MOSC domain-containing protein YiiM